MAIYCIAGITLDFTYQYPDFFEDNIEKYRIEDHIKAQYTMKTEVVDYMDMPKGTIVTSYKNRLTMLNQDKSMIVVTDPSGEILEFIEHTHDYTDILIRLSTKLGHRLAEKEYMLTSLMFMELAIKAQRLTIHGSAFKINDGAIIIAASSGVGKSTHVTYWLEAFDACRLINDDKPLIHSIDHQLYVSGSPWSGQTKGNDNLTVPLKALVFYHQADINLIKTMTSDDKLVQLMHHALRPRSECLMNHALSIMDHMMRDCLMLEYHAINQRSSVYPLYDKIFGGSS